MTIFLKPDRNIDNLFEILPKVMSDIMNNFDLDSLVFHGHAWLVGVITQYVLDPSKDLESEIKSKDESFGFSMEKPVVGIQVRRTDKVGK